MFKLVGYVDDGAYSCRHKNPANSSDILIEKSVDLSAWMQNNKLINNPDKSNLLVLGPKKIDRKRSEVCITAGNFTIKPADTKSGINTYWKANIFQFISSL